MLNFKKLTKNAFDEIKVYFEYEAERQKRNRVRISDKTPGSVRLWFREYDVEYAVAGDCVIFYSATSEGKKCYYYPIGKHKKTALRLLAEHIRENGGIASIAAVGEGTLSKISREMFISEAYASRDYADYIYLKVEFENPVGRKHHKRKNLINRFMAEYPDACVQFITSESLAQVKEYYEDYCRRNPGSSSTDDMEYRALKSLFDDFDFDCFTGGVLWAGGRILGFTVAQVYGDTVYVHIEKAEKDIPGAYQMLNKSFLLLLDDPEIKYVNREEDMGLPGLRRSKMAYCPAWLEYKYTLQVSVE